MPGPATRSAVSSIPAQVRWPDIGYDSTNGVYLVVTGNGFIQGQFVAPSGAMLGAPFQINSTDYAQTPRVSYSAPANAFLVTWHATVGNVAVIRGRLIRYGAGAVTGDINISYDAVLPSSSYWEIAPAVTSSTATGEFIVAWTGNYPGSVDIFFRRVASNGTPQGPPTQLSAGGNWERDPSVAYNAATNEYLVAYTGYTSYSYVQVVRVQPGTGAVLGQETIGTAGAIYVPEVDYNSLTGKYFVTWYAGSPVPGMYGRVVSAGGLPEGSVVPVSTSYFAYDANDLAFNHVTGTYLMVTHGGSIEDAAVEITGAGTPFNQFIVTNSGGTGNFNPRVVNSMSQPQWMLATSRSFATLSGQFVAGPSGGGQPAPPAATPAAPVPAHLARTAAKADFNGDMKPDLLWRRSDGLLSLWKMNQLTAAQQVLINPSVPDSLEARWDR